MIEHIPARVSWATEDGLVTEFGADQLGVDENGAITVEASAGAVFSRDREHRYYLWRKTGCPLDGRCLFVMLNPSTADAFKLDPTVTRCLAWAFAWGYGTLEVVNLYALRSPDPAFLHGRADPVGPWNDKAIRASAENADRIVVAWGAAANLAPDPTRVDQVRQLLADAKTRPLCLGRTADGSPIHPLARGKHRVPDDVTPVPYA